MRKVLFILLAASCLTLVSCDVREDKNIEVYSENYINNNPTEDQLKDNKNGNVAVILSVIASFLVIALFVLIVSLFSKYVWLGALSIVLLLIPASLQKVAVKKAKKQLNINGKGKVKLLLVKYVFPIIAAVISVVIIFYLIGLYLK